MAMDVEELTAGAVVSSVSMVDPQEHKKGPDTQTSEDAGGGGGKRRIRRNMVYSRGKRKEYRP